MNENKLTIEELNKYIEDAVDEEEKNRLMFEEIFGEPLYEPYYPTSGSGEIEWQNTLYNQIKN